MHKLSDLVVHGVLRLEKRIRASKVMFQNHLDNRQQFSAGFDGLLGGQKQL
jgi:hypothetical protein